MFQTRALIGLKRSRYRGVPSYVRIRGSPACRVACLKGETFSSEQEAFDGEKGADRYPGHAPR